MMATNMSSREFNQDTSRAKKAAQAGPVFITDRGRPGHVLLTIEEYERSRSRRVAVLTDRSFTIGRMGLIHSPLLCLARDAFMRLAFNGPIQRKTNELIADTRF
jgi:antitoxin (DNA-binding transcriptional repressor) of toxin-antitoxin stability system